MGEANRRGTFEERKILGEAKKLDQEKRRIAAKRRRELLMTPEEKAERHRARILWATVAAMGYGRLSDL
jgi:hypothetical protein